MGSSSLSPEQKAWSVFIMRALKEIESPFYRENKEHSLTGSHNLAFTVNWKTTGLMFILLFLYQ
jgi:hypothetical protein